MTKRANKLVCTSIIHSVSHCFLHTQFKQITALCKQTFYVKWVNTHLTFWHRSFTFNSNKSPTWYNNFPVYYPDVRLQLNMFRAFSRPSSRAQWLQWQSLVLPSYRGDSRAVFVVGPARPRTQYGYHHDTKVKPEAATAVVELLMMGGRTPETCWAVNERQDNKLKNCCIWLVIYLDCTMMHGLTNLKFCNQFILFSCIFSKTGVVVTTFAICVFVLLSVQVYVTVRLKLPYSRLQYFVHSLVSMNPSQGIYGGTGAAVQYIT